MECAAKYSWPPWDASHSNGVNRLQTESSWTDRSFSNAHCLGRKVYRTKTNSPGLFRLAPQQYESSSLGLPFSAEACCSLGRNLSSTWCLFRSQGRRFGRILLGFCLPSLVWFQLTGRGFGGGWGLWCEGFQRNIAGFRRDGFWKGRSLEDERELWGRILLQKWRFLQVGYSRFALRLLWLKGTFC